MLSVASRQFDAREGGFCVQLGATLRLRSYEMTIVLLEAERAQLMKPVRGEGGWQRLLRRLQAQTDGYSLSLAARDVEMIRKYRDRYGSGGWQTRLGFLKRIWLDSAA
jgi:hypothetical protein